MEQLIRIIQRFDKYKLSHIDILNNKESYTNSTKLYKAILEGSVANDDDAAKLLFGAKARKSDSRYTTFKSEFKKKVFDTYLFVNIDLQDIDEANKIIYEVNYRWMVLKNLMISHLSPDVFEFALDLLKYALDHEYTEMAVLILPHIKSICANNGNKKSHSYYTALEIEIKQQYEIENKARHYQELLRLEYVNSVSFRPENSNVAKKYFTELIPFMDKYPKNVLHLYARIVETYIYSAVNDYDGILDVAERALAFFYSKKQRFNLAISIFEHQKMVALMYLHQFDVANESIEIYLKQREYSTFNWFKGIESQVFLLFRKKEYDKAVSVYKEATSLPAFKTLKGLNKEMWHLFLTHFRLLHISGVKIDLSFKKVSPIFSIQKFINKVPTCDQDKRGMHLVLLLIEICILIFQDNYNAILDREEGIKKQLARYTDGNNPNYRFTVFIKMLLTLLKYFDNPTKLTEYFDPLLSSFSKTDNRISEQLYRSEVIELEDIWAMVLKKFNLFFQ